MLFMSIRRLWEQLTSTTVQQTTNQVRQDSIYGKILLVLRRMKIVLHHVINDAEVFRYFMCTYLMHARYYYKLSRQDDLRINTQGSIVST
jgi:hypothetical protein